MNCYLIIASTVMIMSHHSTTNVQAIKESTDIELSGAQSIYPCLDSFELMVTGSTIKSIDSNFHRIIRLFYSNDSLAKRDIRDLIYLREYTVPFNDLLKLDCQSNIQFILDSKIHCFQYISRNLISEAIIESSRLFCFPTYQSDVDTFNSISKQLNDNRENANLNHLKFNTLQSSEKSMDSVTVNNQSDEFNEFNSLVLECQCNATTFIALNLNHIAHYFVYFAHGEFKLQINKCNNNINTHDHLYNNSDGNDYLHNLHKNEISIETKVFNKVDDDVCIVNLTSIPGYKRIKVSNVEVNSIVYSPTTAHRSWNTKNDNSKDNINDRVDHSADESSINLRDGIFSISPLIPINNSSLFQYLHSSYLRIESKNDYSLKLILSISHILDEDTIESNLQLLHVIMATIFAICLFTCCISTVICISAGRETEKVITSDIMENATMLSDPGTFIGNNANSELIAMENLQHVDDDPVKKKPNASLSQFDLDDDVDSMEMDYYDYHCSINGGKKTPLLQNAHRDKLQASGPVDEQESAFNV